MKYLIIFLLLTAQASANIPERPKKLNVGVFTQSITLTTTDGELIEWPKKVLPTIRIYSVSTKTEHFATYVFTVRTKDGIYKVPVTENSYFKYKREMGIK